MKNQKKIGKIKGKRVCHLTSAHSRYDIRIFQKECISLAANGFDVSLVVADGLPDEEINKIKIYGVPRETGKRGRLFRASRSVYKRGLELDADIYHFHDPELLWYGNKLKKRNKCVVFDAHEDLPRQIEGREYIPRFSRSLISYVLEKYEDYCCSKYDAIITATPFINKRFLKVNDRCANVNNYPFLNEFKSDGKVKKWENTNYVCYVGAIAKIRGLTQVVQALEKTNAALQLAGGIMPLSYKDELMKTSGWDKVNYFGNVSREKVKEILNTSVAGIVTFLPYPNHTNAQPNKLFEYMSSGIPVIASHYPLWKNIIEEYDAGICVDPENIEEIANAITYLIEHPLEAKTKGLNGRVAIEGIFNWEQEEKKLIEIYNNMSV